MWRALTVAMVTATAATAAADPSLTAMASPSYTPHAPIFGVMTDLGVPDGATASLVVRPIRPLRLELGVADNGVGPGVRGGVTWIPLHTWATPTLGVSYGRFFERDANPLLQMLSGDPTLSSPLLERVGYDFASVRAGIELGRERFTFFIHAGISGITGQIHNVDSATMPSAGSTVSITTTDPQVRIVTVSASVGFILYLF